MKIEKQNTPSPVPPIKETLNPIPKLPPQEPLKKPLTSGVLVAMQNNLVSPAETNQPKTLTLDYQENKSGPKFVIQANQNNIRFSGTATQISIFANWSANIPSVKEIVIDVDWKSGISDWGNKGFKIEINKKPLDKNKIPLSWQGEEGFIKANKSGKLIIPWDGRSLDSISLMNAAGHELDVTLSVKYVASSDPILQSSNVSAKANAEAHTQLKRLLISTPQDHYLDQNAPYYIPENGGLLVKYGDSKMIHTEGQTYASYLLTSTNSDTHKAQILFDQLWLASEKHFPHAEGSSLLGWLRDDPKTAADSDIFRAMNMYRAAKNQQAGKWNTPTIPDLDYMAQAKILSKDFLDKEVAYFGKDIAIPTSGYLAKAGSYNSHFVAETDQEVIFQYNPSYSFELATTELSDLDTRWSLVKATQNKINDLIFKKHGMTDWCIVKINKNTHEISLGDAKELSLISGHEAGQDYAPRIEWPRFLIGHMLNVLEHKDKQSLAVLSDIKNKYSTNLTGLAYSGYRNELVTTMVVMMKSIFNELSPDDVSFFNKEVLGSKTYYGNKDFNSMPHTFQQLLIGMMVQALKK